MGNDEWTEYDEHVWQNDVRERRDKSYSREVSDLEETLADRYNITFLDRILCTSNYRSYERELEREKKRIYDQTYRD